MDPRFEFKKIQWVVHETPESVVLAFFNMDPDLPITSLDDVGFGGECSDGSEVDLDGHEFVDTIRMNGMWGFCMTKESPPVIHYWHDGKRDLSTLVYMLGHEIGHASGTPLEDHIAEEQRADSYGAAVQAVIEHLKLK